MEDSNVIYLGSGLPMADYTFFRKLPQNICDQFKCKGRFFKFSLIFKQPNQITVPRLFNVM